MTTRKYSPAVNALADRAIVLAYREATAELETSPRDEGFEVTVQRATYNESELRYSRTIRCLMNHLQAWRSAAARAGCTVIVESDFVPCIGFGRARAPFDPQIHGPLAWAFLYGGGPRLIWARENDSFEGHAACPVAVLLTPGSAALLVRFGEEHLKSCDPTAHSMWDTIFQWWIMGWGGRCFFPLRHLGEHGGVANPEHGAARVGWASRIPGLRRLNAFNNHHAECLLGPLSFLPPYARGSRTRFFLIRFVARAVGWARLFAGHVATPARELPIRDRCRVYLAALLRLC